MFWFITFKCTLHNCSFKHKSESKYMIQSKLSLNSDLRHPLFGYCGVWIHSWQKIVATDEACHLSLHRKYMWPHFFPEICCCWIHKRQGKTKLSYKNARKSAQKGSKSMAARKKRALKWISSHKSQMWKKEWGVRKHYSSSGRAFVTYISMPLNTLTEKIVLSDFCNANALMRS